MGADGALDKAAPPSLVLDVIWAQLQGRCDQSIVERQELWTRASLPNARAGVLREPRDHASATEQLEVMRQCDGISHILKLSEQLRERDDLARVLARQPEQLT